MLVLGIESTCDETACSIVRNGNEILSNVVASQIDLHAQYGGVVPELACRRHVDLLLPVLEEALKQANVQISDIDLIAVSQGPGLVGALLIGLNAAKALSLALNKPFIGVNHIQAHLYAALMSHPETISFPCLGVVLSGGHTSLLHMQGLSHYSPISSTVDDAIGEAFDKVATILQLPYPGGPQIEELAKSGNAARYPFRAGNVKGKPLHFSFSGIKTAVLYTVRESALSTSDKCDVAASFQRAAFDDIVYKAVAAAKQYECRTLLFGGGVTNNRYLRHLFAETASEYQCVWPAIGLSLDNAAMIAGMGYHLFQQRGIGDPLTLEAYTRVHLKNENSA